MILVTGASGHIGNVLVRELVRNGNEVSILTKTGKTPECLNDLDIKVFKADLQDKEAIDKAVGYAEIVFHLAGIISISSFNSPILRAINVKGTEYIVNSCKNHGIKRLLYTSSVHALPEPNHDYPKTETKDVDINNLKGPYSRSKALATKIVFEAEGLDVVVCYPSAVMGPHDFRGSEAGKLIADYVKNKLPAYVDGAYDFVDVRDVAQGLISAMENGRAGEGYILSGEKMTLRQFFDILSKLEPDMNKPKFRVPYGIALGSAWVLESASYLIGVKPLFTAFGLKTLRSNCNYSNNKARMELGYSARPIEESIRDSLLWLKENNRI